MEEIFATANETAPGRALNAEKARLLACVHCGLCLEACPTYVHTGDENDGPRGRLYLMRAVEEGRLAPSAPAFSRHIDRCLGCRACESACPAGVEYGVLLEAARSDIAAVGRRTGWTGRALRILLRRVWPYPRRLAIAFALARVFRDLGLPRLLTGARLSRLMPSRPAFALMLLDSSSPAGMFRENDSRRESNDGAHADGGGVGDDGKTGTSPCETTGRSDAGARRAQALLFKGCVTEGLFARVNRATRRVLEANGCATEAPGAQACCGALHAHAGDLEGARALARRNVDAFASAGGEAVVTNAGGCGAMLVSYAHLLADDPAYAEPARRFAARVRDVSQQLEATGARTGAPLGEVSATYDASCHLLHGQGVRSEPQRLLASIPGLRLAPLEGAEVCCGGAGVYNLLQPELSSRVLAEKMGHVRETGAGVVATGNVGCHMQLGAGARLHDAPLAVCHPIELLDESYRRAGFYAGEAGGRARAPDEGNV